MKKGNIVLVISLLVVSAIVLSSLLAADWFQTLSDLLYVFAVNDMGWLYLLAMLAFVVFVFFVALSGWGRVRLGDDDSKPEYSTASWFAMLFTAGMGIGLVFWGVAEPISHFVSPASGIEPCSEDAASFAMSSSFMHWGVQPWSAYAVVGLCIAYFQYRKKRKGRMGQILCGSETRLSRTASVLVDVLTCFATIAGVVTSLGLGVLQINSGMNYLFDIPNSLILQIAVIVILSVIAIVSAVLGVDRGIRRLSKYNALIALVLVVIVVIVGPQIEMAMNFTNGLGQYIGSFFSQSLAINPFGDNQWYEGWRIFYWAWWIAWAPFVGVFIARISKGRTVREFVLGVVLAPTLASLLWFAIFGTLGLDLAFSGELSIDQLQGIVAAPETGLFIVLEHYPLGIIASVIALVLLVLFFTTSADSGTLVLAMTSSEDSENPPRSLRIIWGALQALLAIGLLSIGQGQLKMLQTISLVAALPFLFVMIYMCCSVLRGLRTERESSRIEESPDVPEHGEGMSTSSQ